MKRANLKQEFHGEPDMAEEGTEVSGLGPDEVTVDIKRGNITLRVPSTVPDDQVVDAKYFEQYVQCVFELEDGSQITIILNEDRDGVDVRVESPQQLARERETASRLEAEKSPRVEE
ncbi:MAG: hypothetical protein ACM3JD_06830 [Rudaea sp.]